MPKESFNPIDPTTLDIDEFDAHIERLEEIMWLEQRIPRAYQGSGQFFEFIQEGKIGIGVTIRIEKFDSGDDWHYQITNEGLVNMTTDDHTPRSPEELLDTPDNPEWEILGY